MSNNQAPQPSIDVAPLFSDDLAARDAVDQAVGQACQAYSSFMAVGLPPDLRPDQAKMQHLFTLFSQPESILFALGSKRVNPHSERSYRGYTVNERGNQFFDIGPEPTVTGPPIKDLERLIEPNAWPPAAAMPGWQAAMITYFRTMENFSKLVIGALARYWGVDEGTALKRYHDSNSTLRLLNYPLKVGDAAETEIGTTHTDNCGLSLLWQDAKGLQMQTPGGDWYNIAEVSDGISVHLGEALETQAAGRVRATPHRVLSHRVERHSIGFFLEPSLFGSVKPFSVEAIAEDDTPIEDTYAASLIETLRKTGRA